MKKIKVFITLILIMFISLTVVNKTEAHSLELDPDNLISLPYFIYGATGGTISVKSTVTNYKLYYQEVWLTDSNYTQIETIRENGKKELETLKAEIDALDEIDTEIEQLKTIVEEKEKIYNDLKTNNATDEEIEIAQQEYNTALNNYNDKVTEYNQLSKEKTANYNNKVTEINSKIKELTPMYTENKWKLTEDGKVFVDTSEFSGDVHYVLWAKLICSDGTIVYDEQIYTSSGTKVEVESISLDKTSITLNEGENYTLTATVLPEDATNKTVIWSSDNEKVAKVEGGKITAISEGTATITATSGDGEHKATCKVTVNKKHEEVKVETIKLDKTTVSLTEGSSLTITATITPSNATDKTVVWASDNEKVAKVEGGKITAISEGTATITAKTSDGEYVAECKVTVTKVVEDSSEQENDSTTAPTEIPKAGGSKILITLIIFTIVLAIIFKSTLKNYRDIK